MGITILREYAVTIKIFWLKNPPKKPLFDVGISREILPGANIVFIFGLYIMEHNGP